MFSDMKNEGKDVFYPKAEQSLVYFGYKFFNENEIKGKGKSHRSKPDYIAIKSDRIIIGEIKSPNESPRSSSWRQPQNSDTIEYEKVRMQIDRLEKCGDLSKNVGGHEIIIIGQIPDYFYKLGYTYDLPIEHESDFQFLGGYTYPSDEDINVQVALSNCRKILIDKFDIGNGATTIIYNLGGVEGP